MANPNKQNPRDAKLALALQFANLGLEQQGQQSREHAQRVAQALQMLGLQNQQQQDLAQQQHAAEVLGLQRGNYQDEARHRGVMEQQNADETKMRGQQSSDAVAMQLVEHMLGNPQIPTDTALGFLPESQKPKVDQMRAGVLQGKVGQATQAVAPLYQANANHPEKIASALKLLEPAYASQPEVWNGIPWESLNQSLPSPLMATPAPGRPWTPPALPTDTTPVPLDQFGSLKELLNLILPKPKPPTKPQLDYMAQHYNDLAGGF